MSKSKNERRFYHTMQLIDQFLTRKDQILDLGIENQLSRLMSQEGYSVSNTGGEDLDDHYENLKHIDADAVTGFEILEHLLNPYSVLKNLPGKKLLVTVPLSLWFSQPFRDVNADPREWHYHEFTDWQFDRLLEKSGWDIQYREKWTGPTNKIGFRPLLRRITPRYYAVYAVRRN